MEELAKVNTSFPAPQRLEGWTPKYADEKRKEVVAEKKIDNMRVLKGFEPIGVWKEVYDLMVLREEIWRETEMLNETARKYRSLRFMKKTAAKNTKP